MLVLLRHVQMGLLLSLKWVLGFERMIHLVHVHTLKHGILLLLILELIETTLHLLLLLKLVHILLIITTHHSSKLLILLHLILIHLLLILIRILVEGAKSIKCSIFVIRLRKLRILIVHLIQILHIKLLLLFD